MFDNLLTTNLFVPSINNTPSEPYGIEIWHPLRDTTPLPPPPQMCPLVILNKKLQLPRP